MRSAIITAMLGSFVGCADAREARGRDVGDVDMADSGAAPICVDGGHPDASKGPVPLDSGSGGMWDPRTAPTFVPVLARDGTHAGYFTSMYLTPPEPNAPVVPFPVYDDDLRCIIGYLHAGKGYVPIGTDPDDIPELR